eukprot:NODE_193_length_2212_cov_73.476190_g164_i0.p2 GENE.NODE_193_length_2212_cov_73.476190_g164_i0~~NODE_193_length_2212_cov_73.476190_g164_i0.p2  ORF type:complete len:63 (-),score=0.31 NODE_193_length_2212_cov_73.476190_g164_i0:1222-1410(-)
MKDFIELKEQAEKRDHRNMGVQRKLFFFDKSSPGSAFWLPHGTKVFNKLQDMMKEEYLKRGF